MSKNNVTIKSILYQTIHRNEKSVMQIADELGISSSYLARTALPLDESGAKFPLDFLVPLLRSTNDYSVLKHIANLCGFLLVEIPETKDIKSDAIDLIIHYQDVTCTAIKALRDFFSNPNESNYKKVTSALLKVMENSSAAKSYIDKSFPRQME